MGNVSILDCTLRDGGYINGWNFGDDLVNQVFKSLTGAGVDIIEVGYLNSQMPSKNGSTIFQSMNDIASLLSNRSRNPKYVVMADVNQVTTEDIPEHNSDPNNPDGVRVVFYKRDIGKALKLCEQVKLKGYELFVQPMVTIDYSKVEFSNLIEQFSDITPDGVAIVDSFGMMGPDDFLFYYQILNELLINKTAIGIHSHDNLHNAVAVASHFMKMRHNREVIIDSSILGMGRGAGNLKTELSALMANQLMQKSYDIQALVKYSYKSLCQLQENKPWGPNIFYFLTACHGYHPNYAGYLLAADVEVDPSVFNQYILSIPENMKTDCKRDYVLGSYSAFVEAV